MKELGCESLCIHLSCSSFHYITLHTPLKPTSLVFIIVAICRPCFTIWYYLFIFPSWNAPILTFVKHCSFLFLPAQYSFSFSLRISVCLRSPCSSLTTVIHSRCFCLITMPMTPQSSSLILLFTASSRVFHRLPIGLRVMIFLKTCPFILFHSLC